ncbi:hypothetical protein FK85_30485 [Halorubrum saccharovorum]|uniref:Uncharacterized protein n=1 Tax=Halorubrum saccharovorum TaxID=2248 RepID=A0A0F8AUH7_9EURY|nr:hypothetical protein [Halorubrum saccharovorum]KKF39191.1 hypothetical protein FK85_30485 [Halorubrum saccharovorum]
MTELTRRTAIYGLGAGSVTALAGCSDGADPGAGDGGDGTNGGTGNGTGDGGDGSDEGSGVTDTAVQQTGGALSGPAWDPESRRGFCVLVTEEDETRWLFDDAPAEVREFVEATDFSSSVLAYVESVGPTTCHDRIEFADVGVEEGTLVASATVENTADDNEACGEAITFSGALLRVTADPLPDSLRLSVTDGWGETGEVRGEDGLADPEALPGGVRPDGDPPNVPASFDCETEGFERHPQAYESGVNWGGGGGAGSDAGGDGPLALRAVIPGDDAGSEELSIARGTRFRIELTNVSGREASVGNQGKYNLELRTEAGWTEIRGGDEGATFEYTDEAIGVRPGETPTWEFEMTESGLVEGGPHADDLRVCPNLVPGRYRFVFWGAADLAVAFDYVG